MKRSNRTALRGVAFLLLVAACGSRTGLLVENTSPTEDAATPLDAGRDAPRDALRDVARDVAPDVTPPPIDARPPVDANRSDCPDAASTLVYLVGDGNQLYSFYPPQQEYRLIGQINCPSVASPFSMAVDRAGVAYVLYSDGELFRVSTRNASCSRTIFEPNQLGISTFGMGFSSDRGGPAETLFVASTAENGSPPGLATIDIANRFRLRLRSGFAPNRAELTGTGDGRLYAYYADDQGTDSFIGEISKQSGEVLAEKRLVGISQGTAWAFAFWGGDFYTFSGLNASSSVTRYRPGDDTVVAYGSAPARVVGAGVSTCAPGE
jgi:hypothetical protein